jgi:energy-converting hydrogenase Eha subunit F
MKARLAIFLTLLFLASFAIGGFIRIARMNPTPTPTPQPTATTTPADPLAWYRSLPTASGCPKSVRAGLKPFYPQCPDTQEEDPE